MNRLYAKYFKRIFDLTIILMVLPLILPIFILLSILLFFAQREIFFVQERPGKLGKPFNLYKFKTLKNAVHAGQKDSERMTIIGKFLRKTSLDELPQILNILKNEMSFVGPRPLLMEYLPLYSKKQRKRHDVLPGITGLAQVNGRNALNWSEKFDLDVFYVENASFWFDIKIIFKTFLKLFKSSEVGIDTEKFKGNSK